MAKKLQEPRWPVGQVVGEAGRIYVFRGAYRPGKKYLNADALSHLSEASYDDGDHSLEHQEPVSLVLCEKSHGELRAL